MKKIICVLSLILITCVGHAQDTGIKFFKGSWDEAVAKAKKEKKKIFVDFYTEWCGPCLNMALTVFTYPEVGAVYNDKFVCVKIDAEKGEGKELAQKYMVRSYPTYAFIDPKTQELVHRSGGNKPAADFIADVDGAMNKKLSSIYLDAKYESKDFDLNFMKDYIRMKKVSGGSSIAAKLFDEMIEMGASLEHKGVWDLYVKCVSGYDNPYVKQISSNYSKFVSLYGAEAVDAKLASATSYAPLELLNSLCDFEGKSSNIEMRKISSLFQSKNYKEAFAAVEMAINNKTIDHETLIHSISFYVRLNPKYNNSDSFELLALKVKWLRYIAYNKYVRDDAMTHYYYATGLEMLIKKANEEGVEIPAFVFDEPTIGKTEYDMRHPLLKHKPTRK